MSANPSPSTARAAATAAVAAAAVLLSSAGCDGDASPPPAGVWTWIDMPDMKCDDGSGTGIAVNPAPNDLARKGGGDVLVYFMGGGACWDPITCLVLNTAVHGPFGKAQWEAAGQQSVANGFDRARAGNPFRDFTWIFVPYCTGDLHAGSNIASYDTAFGARQYYHVGRLNTQAMLARVQGTWPAAARVVVSGSSAGGYGATLNYDLIRRAYPGVTVALVDDAGPLLAGDSIPASSRDAWYANWKIGNVTDELCPDCRGDLSAFYPALAARYPDDRMALLTSLQDMVIRAYFQLAPADFEAQLRALITDRLAPLPRFETFVIPGEQHTLLGDAATVTAGGLTLDAWLGQMVGGDAAWASVGP